MCGTSPGEKTLRAHAAGAVGCIVVNLEDKLFVPSDSKGQVKAADIEKFPTAMVASSTFATNQRWCVAPLHSPNSTAPPRSLVRVEPLPCYVALLRCYCGGVSALGGL